MLKKKKIVVYIVIIAMSISLLGGVAEAAGGTATKRTEGTKVTLKVGYWAEYDWGWIGSTTVVSDGNSVGKFDKQKTTHKMTNIKHNISIEVWGCGQLSLNSSDGVTADIESLTKGTYKYKTKKVDYIYTSTIWKLYSYWQTHEYRGVIKNKINQKLTTVHLQVKAKDV